MPKDTILNQLVAMSNRLGDPALDLAILGEGNTSARADAETFWVKASGAELRTVDRAGFVCVRFERALALLEAGDLDDAGIKAGLEAAKADPSVAARPSVETVLHALALQLEGIAFVGHTHPTAVNTVLCSQKAEEAVSGRLFPDEIVLCGPASVYVPYTDPGLPLARKVRDLIAQHVNAHGELPKVILMQNHGLIALGKSATEVENITAMCVKAFRVLAGTYALGGPHFLSPETVACIYTRPDELYRRKVLGSL
jgi:rhamnose utilization protein RhaD (predicted bifunctional aldolase and dehydrogenase)